MNNLTEYITDQYPLFLVEGRSTREHKISTIDNLVHALDAVEQASHGVARVRIYSPLKAGFKQISKQRILAMLSEGQQTSVKHRISYFGK
jgi:hypothetical protein